MRALVFVLVLLLLLSPLASGDVIHTRDGQRLSGKVVEESKTHLKLKGKYGELIIDKRDVLRREPDPSTLRLMDGTVLIGEIVRRSDVEVIVRTEYGVLVVPTAAIRKIDEPKPSKGERPAAGKEKPRRRRSRPDPLQIRRLHMKAFRLNQEKRYREVIAVYEEILEADPDDDTALYNTACAHSLLGEKEKAIAYLEQSVLAGFTDFGHIERDKDLDNIRAEAGYVRILARRDELFRKAAEKATVRLKSQLKARGSRVDYEVFVDEKNRFTYLHTKTEKALQAIRDQLAGYAALQWRDLFPNRVSRPLFIVLLPRRDGRILRRGVGGTFDPRTNTLICGNLPSMKLAKSNVLLHEFTHALHFADQSARRQSHPIWLVEGLATLLESAIVKGDRLVPRHSARLNTVQKASKSDGLIPWLRLMGMSQREYMAQASIAYAQSRYMLFYMWEKGFLKKFYAEYTNKANYKGDKTALQSFEAAFGKPLNEVEHDWKTWLLQQKAPPIPFIGVSTQPVALGLRVTRVQDGSGADKAEIEEGDIIVGVDGMPVSISDDLLEVLSTHDVSDIIEMDVLRGEKPLNLKVTLGARPAGLAAQQWSESPYLGISVESTPDGVAVREVEKGSPAASAGLRAGDRIRTLDGRKIRDVRHWLRLLRRKWAGRRSAIGIERAGKTLTLEVEFSKVPRGAKAP
jgi:tetratricopeptide (TPR) repeat protein